MVWSMRMAAQYRLPLRRERRNDRRAMRADGERTLSEHASKALLAGVVRDPQFGPCVMLGLGGILAEAIGDVVFAAAPLSATEARRMIDGLRAARGVLEPLRGEPAVDQDALAAILVGLGRLVVERADMRSVDVNPLIVRDGKPIAVDALAILGAPVPELPPRPAADVLARFRPLFHPRGVIVAGASSQIGRAHV